MTCMSFDTLCGLMEGVLSRQDATVGAPIGGRGGWLLFSAKLSGIQSR